MRNNKMEKDNERVSNIKAKRDSVSRKLASGSDAVSVEQLVDLEIALAIASARVA